jgi:hypothetical protein
MRMAAHTGRTLQELGESMSSPEFTAWQAFDNLYGYPDIYFMTARICHAALAPYSTKPPKAWDYVPYFAPERPRTAPQTVKDHKAIMRSISRKSRI